MSDIETIQSEVTEKTYGYDFKITLKKIFQRVLITLVSSFVGFISTWILTKFGIEIPDDIKTDIVVGMVIAINSAEAGLKNWYKNCDRDNDGIIDEFENLYKKLSTIPIIKQVLRIYVFLFVIKKK